MGAEKTEPMGEAIDLEAIDLDSLMRILTEADSLLEWAVEQRLMKDPRRIAKLYDEARRRWGPTRYETSKIVEATLDKMSLRVKPDT